MDLGKGDHWDREATTNYYMHYKLDLVMSITWILCTIMVNQNYVAFFMIEILVPSSSFMKKIYGRDEYMVSGHPYDGLSKEYIKCAHLRLIARNPTIELGPPNPRHLRFE